MLHIILVACILLLSGCKPQIPEHAAQSSADPRQLALGTEYSAVNSPADIQINTAIRKGILLNGLSDNAQNIKVVTKDGRVTLSGVVNSADEKQAVARLVSNTPGVIAVYDLTEIAQASLRSSP